jgi:hypothetical protein
LERATHRGGRDTIDHPRNGSDDLANALCGAAVLARKPGYGGFGGAWVSGPDEDEPSEQEQARAQKERVDKLVKLLLRGEPMPF